MTPMIPVSWGELIDKITILEIKAQRLTSPEARKNVVNEIERIGSIAANAEADNPKLAELKKALRGVNETLWRTEDRIREKEALQAFDKEFIMLARTVYHTNDERGRIKLEINRLLKSDLSEEKQYATY